RCAVRIVSAALRQRRFSEISGRRGAKLRIGFGQALTTDGGTMLDRNFFVRYYDAYASEDADALGAFYADDVTLTSSQGVIRGKDELLGTYRYITSLFHDRMTPDTIIVDGDRAAIEITD